LQILFGECKLAAAMGFACNRPAFLRGADDSYHNGGFTMERLLMLAAGGAFGTVARYALNGLISGQQGRFYAWPATFPLGTLIVNVTGCFAIGLIASVSGPALGRAWLQPEWRDFLMIGFCGGYTTFSSYAIQSLNLARDGEWLWVGLNIVASNVLSLFAVYLGWVLGRLLQAKFHGGAV
jgi:CrcB protein